MIFYWHFHIINVLHYNDLLSKNGCIHIIPHYFKNVMDIMHYHYTLPLPLVRCQLTIAIIIPVVLVSLRNCITREICWKCHFFCLIILIQVHLWNSSVLIEYCLFTIQFFLSCVRAVELHLFIFYKINARVHVSLSP